MAPPNPINPNPAHPERPSCPNGQVAIGPFRIFAGENVIESILPSQSAPVTKEVFICGTYEEVAAPGGGRRLGVVSTRHFNLVGPSFDRGRWDYFRWDPRKPLDTDPRFDILSMAFAMESNCSALSGLNVYTSGVPSGQEGIDTLLGDKPTTVIVGHPEANAGYVSTQNLIFFGSVPGRCSFGSDLDVALHEFGHRKVHAANPYLGFLYNDISGMAMHEGYADFCAGNEHDSQMGEAVALCLKPGDLQTDPKEGGLRDIGTLQTRLYLDTEPHNLSEHYSKFLWFCRQGLAQYLGSPQKAREIMAILSSDMVEYIPSSPRPIDFVRAFINALDDFLACPDFQRRYTFNPQELGRVMSSIAVKQALLSQLISRDNHGELFSSDGNYIPSALYPMAQSYSTTREEDEKTVGEYLKKGIVLKRAYTLGRQAFFQQYYLYEDPTNRSNKAVYEIKGAGVRLIRTVKGVKRIDTTIDPSTIRIQLPVANPVTAWARLKSDSVIEDIRRKLGEQIRFGIITAEEIAIILDDLRRSNMPSNVPLVFIRGNPNLQYQIETASTTFYIDTTGNVSVGRTRFGGLGR